MGNLTNIADRLTPSAPIEITFGQQPIATGRKYTTLFGHMASTPGTAAPYSVYTVTNVGDPDAAKAEIDELAGTDSQISLMAYAFVNANADVSTSRNFPAFRVVFLPHNELHFGPSNEAITAVKFLRSDMLVSCYPASDTTNLATLQALRNLISGIDRDLQGQFGSFITVGSIDPLTTAVNYNINDRGVLVAFMPDSNTAAISGATGTTTLNSNVISAVARSAIVVTGDVESGTNVISNVSSTDGFYPGAAISGTGIPSNTTITSFTSNTVTLNANATASGSGVSLSVVNLPTSGIYAGATITGTGIPAHSVVESVSSSTITISASATSSNTSEALTIQNVISQSYEIIASAHAAVMMQSAFPYMPLLGVTIGGLVPPQKLSDRIDINPNGASEQALSAGLSPLYTQAGGTVGFIRTRTTYVLLANNVTAATAYFDWQDLVTLNDFREDVFSITQNPPFNGNPGGTKASKQIAALLKDEILNLAMSYEAQSAFQGVKTLSSQFVVQNSTTSRGRFDFYIPVNVIPGLMVIAGNIEAVSGVSDFTL